MGTLAIRAVGLGKRYRVGKRAVAGTERLLSTLFRGNSNTARDFWALKDVAFEVEQGERVGIIGRNGAGKSTLLKILSRVVDPTEGSAEMRGRIGSLLEVGTGFHPDLTGRENIFLNGAVLGMSQADIRRRFDEIVAFAEVGQFLDEQVKYYSSGMYTRLAFAVAAHLEPEILIVDEVLAVGDVAFQEKSLGKMRDVARGGRTVLFVSHNLAAVTNLCTRAYLLDGGRIKAGGAPSEVIAAYLQSNRPQGVSLSERKDRIGNGRVRFIDIAILDAAGLPLAHVPSGADISIALGFEAEEGAINIATSVAVQGALGEAVLDFQNELVGDRIESLPRSGRILVKVPRLPLVPGRYELNVGIDSNGLAADRILRATELTVVEGDFFGTGRIPHPECSKVMIAHRWVVEGPAVVGTGQRQ